MQVAPPGLSAHQLVMPVPVNVVNGSTMGVLDPAFMFTTSSNSPDLVAAFARYQALIFTHAYPGNAKSRALMVDGAAAPSIPSLSVTVSNVNVPLEVRSALEMCSAGDNHVSNLALLLLCAGGHRRVVHADHSR
jgi:hypothetical protein